MIMLVPVRGPGGGATDRTPGATWVILFLAVFPVPPPPGAPIG
ncbi:hypothetical protein LX15_000709 [Streptoalloteichus tenebrarius]|uniref:Uncharacterized protein n=1 Tax=Streptoalloteichus tenebrarius (strain ATCC 17920 / DSM 40477 / JCM 4838 / CBS 697.72 / NBRC 16177 / NCIMB 11028 / NRRL B-12390 / A12253. 1 / ISP 5477) TaxID=1933 RepID=A0ABT1HND5_STRSD|nr:hypothetical protein [Streptoalloteichus tenebrarius]